MKRLMMICLWLFVLSSCKNGVEFEQSDAVYKTGDSLNWADKNYTEKGWRNLRGKTLDSVYWIRFKPNIHKIADPLLQIGVEVHSFGAFEVYWDGVLIGQNGKPGFNKQPEIPGTHSSVYLLPDSLTKPGKHIMALRATQLSFNADQRSGGYKIDHYVQLIKRPLIITSFMNLMAGAFLIISLYYFFLFVNSPSKNYTTLIFGVTCFLFFALLIAEYIKFYIAIPYPQFYLRLEIIGFLTLATSLLIPLYFSIQFNFKYKLALLCSLAAVLLFIYVYHFRSYDLSAKLFSGSMWLASVVVVVNAIIRKEKGGLLVLIGLIISIALNFYIVYDFGIFFCFILIVLCMLYLHTIKNKENELAHQSSLLLSSRLKLALLKKNIQPHFIKNTLTSLIDWVEESPQQGVVFIQALALEFDILNEIAEETLIPIEKEIELCKAHLTVMQFRKEINYQWNEINIDPSETIPPAIIHTLLENGITHSFPLPNGGISFSLSYSNNDDYKVYQLLTRAKNRPKNNNKKKSTGFKYIEARLAESYGKQWEFNSYEVTEGWCSEIKIMLK